MIFSNRINPVKNLFGSLPVDIMDKQRVFDVISRDKSLHDYKDLISVFDSKEMANLFKSGNNNFSDFKEDIKSMGNVYLYELNYRLRNQILLLSDKINMSHSLESRVPFVSRSIADIALNLPSNMKINLFRNKVALRKTMSGKLPKYILSRKKHHFSMPLYNWHKEGLDSMLLDVLSKEKVVSDGLFNNNYIEKLFKNIDKSPNFYLRQLWGICTASIWYRCYINNESVRII